MSLPTPSRIAGLGLALSLLALPMGASAVAATKGQHAPTITVDRAWFATMPDNGPTYGYFRITNHGGDPKLITGFSAPPCSTLKLEEAHGGGPNSKAAVQMTVAGKTTLAFSRGGYHLVCARGDNTLSPGQAVPVTITFSDGTKVPVTFAVRTFPH